MREEGCIVMDVVASFRNPSSFRSCLDESPLTLGTSTPHNLTVFDITDTVFGSSTSSDTFKLLVVHNFLFFLEKVMRIINN